jgi:hypothetical protein
MKHRYAVTVATGLAATAAVASLGLTSTANAATTVSAARTHPDAARVIVARHTVRTVAKTESQSQSQSQGRVVIDCTSMPQVKPSSYVLACADAGLGLEGMRWVSWTPSLASGYGRFYENNCLPNCASGTVTDYPVLATLWGSAAVPGLSSDERYTQLTLVFTGQRPPAYSGPGKPTYPLSQTFETNAAQTNAAHT